MEVKTTVIKKIDLEKLLKDKGISLRELARLSKVDVSTLCKAKKGHLQLPEKTWEKIKFFI